jgi:hypothetical protein
MVECMFKKYSSEGTVKRSALKIVFHGLKLVNVIIIFKFCKYLNFMGLGRISSKAK